MLTVRHWILAIACTVIAVATAGRAMAEAPTGNANGKILQMQTALRASTIN